MNEGPFGDADNLSRAKNTSVERLARSGCLYSRSGKVRLLKRDELDPAAAAANVERLTIWECARHLMRALEKDGEAGAAKLLRRLGGGRGEEARALAYRLFSICERAGAPEEAFACNSLVMSWPAIREKAGTKRAGN